MSCPSENAIDSFATGGLQEEERQAIESHLAGCPSCRVIVSELARSSLPVGMALTQEIIATATSTFAPGELLADRYRILRFVAEGGMGEVYEAEDTELGVRVALKTVRPSLAQDAKALARFKREVNLARSVTHPNVCRIFDLGLHQRPDENERVPFFTMEFLEGETLSARIARGPLDVDEAFPLVQQMTSALEAAHAVGVTHRDFKSPNVMLGTVNGVVRAKVTDFGLARGMQLPEGDKLSSEIEVLRGSPAYMAPEQLQGRPVTPLVDLYALGVVMFEMTTGTLPFRGASPLMTAMLRVQQDPPSPRSLAPSLPLAWERTILRCLARQPEQRFPDPAHVVRALLEPVPQVPPPRAIRMALPALVVALVGLGIAWSWHARRERTPAAETLPVVAPASPREAPAPTAAGESSSTIVIRSEPSGAHVIVDEEDRGVTPAIVRVLLPHEISLQLDGYQALREVITEPGEVFLELQRRRKHSVEPAFPTPTKPAVVPPIEAPPPPTPKKPTESLD